MKDKLINKDTKNTREETAIGNPNLNNVFKEGYQDIEEINPVRQKPQLKPKVKSRDTFLQM